jgi:CHAT domain-containing protein/tetratricopeptide (TPR) repeat protein
MPKVKLKSSQSAPAFGWRAKSGIADWLQKVGEASRLSRPPFRFVQTPLTIVLAVLCAAVSQGQTVTPIRSENELAVALLKPDKAQRPAVEALLDDHQSLVTPALWDKLIKVAAYFPNPDRSLEIYEIALSVAGRMKDERRKAATYYNIGRRYSSLGKMEEAIRAYLESRKIFEAAGLRRDLIYILSDLGSLYFYTSDFKQAKAYSEQSIALAGELKNGDLAPGAWPDKFGVAGALSTLGALGQREGEYGRAIECFQKSIALYQELGDGDIKYTEGLADNLLSLGRVYRTTGDGAQALALFNRALDIARRLPNRDRSAGVLNSVGVLYLEQEDYAKAVDYLNQSLGLYLALRNQTETAMVLLNLGVAYQRQEDYDRALDCFKRSAQLAEAASDKDVLINAGQGIGVIHRVKGDHKAALDALNQSLTIAEEVDDQTRIAELLWRKAEVFYATGNFSEAATLSEKSLGIARRLRLPKHSYLAATLLGKALLKEGKADTAYQALSLAIEQIEAMRFSVAGREQERQIYFEDKVAAYHLMIDLLAGQGKASEALLYAERAKGRVLLDVLGAGGKQASLPEKEQEEERRLNRAIVALNSEIRIERQKFASDGARIAQLTSQLDSARLKYESFLNLVYAANPDLKARAIRPPSLPTDDLSRLIPDHKTALLEYVVTKERVYLFVLIKPDQTNRVSVKTHVIPINQMDLAGRVRQARHMAADKNPAFTLSSRELYKLLVKPAETQLLGMDRVCVIPDGPLWEVPFQALQNGAGRYLIEDLAIHYAQSLGVLKETARRGETSAGYDSLLAFANPLVGNEPGNEMASQLRNTTGGEAFISLPESETEVRSLARIFGPQHSRVFTGAEANERTFRSLAASSGIIHFATHGMIYDRQPLYSYLLLSKSDADADDDGLLEAREIMNLNLRADLIVLSACETARGKLGAGEGVVGISWAFFVAGCRATVVSQWKVSSSVTSELMIGFYRQLKKTGGRSKANSLRAAALEMMKNERYRHPFYWAGFIIVGGGE